MITVIETKDGFEPIGGNPTLTSLDGECRAPLATILHPTWTAEDRAKFGIYTVEPAAIPAGKTAVGMPRYERDKAGEVIQVRDLQDEATPSPRPNPMDDLRTDMEALAQRVAALEGKHASTDKAR